MFSTIPEGDGSLLIIVDKILSTPSPVLPDAKIDSLVSIPITSSICFFTLSGSDAGRSDLFKTIIISWLFSIDW